MPLIRRLPKRGFSNARHATVHIPINVGMLERFEADSVVDGEILRRAGLANGRADGIKILGQGELSRRLTVRAQAFSASARRKIETAGGTCETVPMSPLRSPDPRKRNDQSC